MCYAVHICIVESVSVCVEELAEEVNGGRESLGGEEEAAFLVLEVGQGSHDSINTNLPDRLQHTVCVCMMKT